MAFNYIDNLEVLTFPVNSDHFPVLVTLNIVNPDSQFNNQKQISWKDKNVKNYKDFLAYSLNVSNFNNDINLMNKNLEHSIFEALLTTNTIKNENINIEYKPWHNSEYKEAKRHLNLSLKISKNESFTKKTVKIYSDTKKNLREIDKKQKNIYNDNIINNICKAINPTEFWGGINYFRKKFKFHDNRINLDRHYLHILHSMHIFRIIIKMM